MGISYCSIQIQASLSAALAFLRCDELFDYSDKLADPSAATILKRHHDGLRQVSDDLTAANEERVANGQLSYPHMQPEWLPNGIQT